VPSGNLKIGGILFRIPKPLELLAISKTRQVFNSTDSLQSTTHKQTKIFSNALPINADSIPMEVEPLQSERVELSKTTPKRNFEINTLPIEMPTGRNPLGSFASALRNLDDQNVIVRVLHYGDSQIEGDRITSQLRAALQEKFGGTGLGLIPIWNTEYLPGGLKVGFSDHIKVNSTVNGKPAQKANCILGAVAEVAPLDSYGEIISIRVNSKQLFNSLSIISGNSDSTYAIMIVVDGTDTLERQVMPYGKVNVLSVKLPSRFERISIFAKNPATVKLYGLLAESGRGVSVSNIGLRGTSGNFFTRFDSHIASDIYRMLNVRLVIMQFGINVVPSNLSSYAYYQKLMEQQIKAVRRFAPQADILVVGVTDMANRFDGELKSNPSVEKVLQAQRYAALSNGVLFWDGYSAMGGEGSIIEWVNASPPLATKDYTHFTSYGAKRFGQKLATALLIAVDNFGMANIDQQPTPNGSFLNE